MSTSDVNERMDSFPVAGHEVDLAHTSLQDSKNLACPNEFYWTMRQDEPVHYDERLDMWLGSPYEDLQTVFADPITFSVEAGYKEQYAKGFIGEFKEILERDGGGFFPDAIMTDPPVHNRIGKLVRGAFTAHRVKQLEPEITAVLFDMNRPNIVRHVAFGGGVHRCSGLALARMEVKVAAREFVKRLKDLKLGIPVEYIRYLPTIATRSIEYLPISFSKR